LKLLRAHGVTTYADGEGLSVTFGPQPATTPVPAAKHDDKPKDPSLPGDAVALALHLGAR